ncbi:MAG: hypothetical protein IJ086_05575 [Clostridium sp.]|nr:hypothetical protein [Clostridium sp.]
MFKIGDTIKGISDEFDYNDIKSAVVLDLINDEMNIEIIEHSDTSEIGEIYTVINNETYFELIKNSAKITEIKKTAEELLNGVNEVISLIDYYQEGIEVNINVFDSHSLNSQARILEKIETIEEVLRLFGINSCEYNNARVVLKNTIK